MMGELKSKIFVKWLCYCDGLVFCFLFIFFVVVDFM